MAKLTDTATHVSDLEGDVVERTSHPADSGPAGLRAGDTYVNTTTKNYFIYDGTQWWGKEMTSSTSTSTTTTSTSTTTSTTTS